MRIRTSCAAMALLLAGPWPARAAPPAAGSYGATLCVTQALQPPSCGPAEVLLSARRVDVRVIDIAYRLALPAQRGSTRLDALVMHGTMQIDEFNGPFEWAGQALRFEDSAKQTRYEVQFGQRQRAAP
jgi:hypothetical protein